MDEKTQSRGVRFTWKSTAYLFAYVCYALEGKAGDATYFVDFVAEADRDPRGPRSLRIHPDDRAALVKDRRKLLIPGLVSPTQGLHWEQERVQKAFSGFLTQALAPI